MFLAINYYFKIYYFSCLRCTNKYNWLIVFNGRHRNAINSHFSNLTRISVFFFFLYKKREKGKLKKNYYIWLCLVTSQFDGITWIGIWIMVRKLFIFIFYFERWCFKNKTKNYNVYFSFENKVINVLLSFSFFF